MDRSNRKTRIRHGGKASANRTVIERRFGRLQDFRRIATRHATLTANFFSAICLVAIFAYWINTM
ncbi:MAG TPA: transposase [Methylocella sp.]|nr:transposase [Methylocella sp.]